MNELIERLCPQGGEEKARIQTHFKQLVKHMENGLCVEIKTPEIDEPEITGQEDAKQKKEKNELLRQYKVKQKIDSTNKNVYITLKRGDFNLYLSEHSEGTKEKDGK